jgi:hypothetical protein
MLKLEYLRNHHNLSDREVIARSVIDLAFRNFLRIPLRGYLPDPSTRSRAQNKGLYGHEHQRTSDWRPLFDPPVGGCLLARKDFKGGTVVAGQSWLRRHGARRRPRRFPDSIRRVSSDPVAPSEGTFRGRNSPRLASSV